MRSRPSPCGRPHGVEQQLEPPFGVARLDRRQAVRDLVVTVELEPGQRSQGAGMRRVELERLAHRLLVAQLDQPVGLGGQQQADEGVHHRPRQRAGELVHHPAVAERLHRRDRLDAEAHRHLRVRVHVHRHQLHGAGGLLDRGLQHGAELLARAAPLGPEVHHHRHRPRPLDHLGVERRVGHRAGAAHAGPGSSGPCSRRYRSNCSANSSPLGVSSSSACSSSWATYASTSSSSAMAAATRT